jgi:hypothetical protein
MRRGLLIIWLSVAFSIIATAQQSSDSTLIKEFWKTTIAPLISGDTVQFIDRVNFPLQGEWGFIMELDKPQSKWNKQDFEQHFSKLFKADVIKQLEKGGYNAVNLKKENGKIAELQIGYGEEYIEDGMKFESGIIFHFRKINGVYKLYLVHAVG